jgi:hypothetical protein
MAGAAGSIGVEVRVLICGRTVAAMKVARRWRYRKQIRRIDLFVSPQSACPSSAPLLPDEAWTLTAGKVARQIQQLPAGAVKESLIGNFGNLVTEGDAGRGTLQVAASTMAQVLRDSPNSPVYSTLERLVRYEHLEVSSDNPH